MAKHLFADVGSKTSLSLEHHIERLALEANVITNAIDNIRSIIPAVSQKIKDAISSFTIEGSDSASATLIQRYDGNVAEIKKAMTYSSFATFDKTLVTVPEGFQGSFLVYTETLISVSREVYANATEALDALNSQLAMFISNAENKQSNKDRTSEYKRIGKHRTEVEKELGKFFSDKNVRSKAYMSEVIGRFEDVDDIHKRCKTLVEMNSDRIMNELKRKADGVYSLLQTVIDDANAEGATGISPQAAKNISEGAYEVAKCIEFVGIFKFRIEQLYTCVIELVNQLKKILSAK